MTGFFIGICVLHTVRSILPSPALNRDFEKIKKQLEDARKQSNILQSPDRPNRTRESVPQSEQNPQLTEVADDGDLGDCVHLMLPIWVRRGQTRLYAETDPEWKAYAKFTKDKTKERDVKMRIALLVQREAYHKYTLWLNHLDVKAMTILVDFIFPIGPPSTYEVPCLYMPRHAPQNTTYGWRQLPHNVGSSMDRIFHPVIMSQAFYAGCKEFARVTYLLCRARITDQITDYRARSSNTGNHSPGTDSAAMPERETAHAEEIKVIESLQCSKISDDRMKEILPFLRGELGEDESRQKFRDVVQTMTFKSAIESATAVFRTHWGMGQMRVLQTASGEAINVRGRIDFEGKRGKLRCIVTAFYDIEADALIGRPIMEMVYLVPNAEHWSIGKAKSEPSQAIAATDPQSTSATPDAAPSASQAGGQARKSPPNISTDNEREE